MSAPVYPLSVRHARVSGMIGDALATLVMIAGAVGMAFYVAEVWFLAIFVVGGVLMAVFFGWSGISSATHVTTYEADAVTVRDAFGEHRLARSDVAGWRHVPAIGGVPRVELTRKGNAKPPRLIISVAKPEKGVIDPAIDAWFLGLPNLDQQDRAENIREIQADADYGHMPEERVRNVVREERIVLALDALALGLAIWLFAWPKPFWTVMGIGIAFPIVVVLLTLLRRDRWRIDRGKEDFRAQTGLMIFLVSIALTGRAFIDWRIVDVWLLLAIVVVFALICVVGVAALTRTALNGERFAIWMVVAMLYGYGAIAPLNYWLDPARAETFRPRVEEKFEGSVRLAPWGPIRTSREEGVSSSSLARLQVGGEACVTLFRGAIYVRSYFVDPCEPAPNVSSE